MAAVYMHIYTDTRGYGFFMNTRVMCTYSLLGFEGIDREPAPALASGVETTHFYVNGIHGWAISI